MLVLTRKLDQEILIGDNIKITVLKTRGNTVRLGIDAPREIRVIRGELEAELNPTAKEQNAEVETEAANFTIVFRNSEQDGEATSDLIDGKDNASPGGRLAMHNASDFGVSGTQRMDTRFVDEEDSVRFRSKLPEIIQRNRLQEIVARVSSQAAAR